MKVTTDSSTKDINIALSNKEGFMLWSTLFDIVDDSEHEWYELTEKLSDCVFRKKSPK